jgi:uncharacterized cupin superfamily protein
MRTGQAAARSRGGSSAAACFSAPRSTSSTPGRWVIYHAHHGSEEVLLVLRGRPTLRTPEGERQVGPGEVVSFQPGPEGAHGLRNDTDEPVRYVVAGTRVSPEVCEYPDLKQVTAQSKHGLFLIHDVGEDA